MSINLCRTKQSKATQPSVTRKQNNKKKKKEKKHQKSFQHMTDFYKFEVNLYNSHQNVHCCVF